MAQRPVPSFATASGRPSGEIVVWTPPLGANGWVREPELQPRLSL